jgi:hypothetical protein
MSRLSKDDLTFGQMYFYCDKNLEAQVNTAMKDQKINRTIISELLTSGFSMLAAN